MSPLIAAVVCSLLILGLFWLDRDQKARTSAYLWVPVVWLSLAGSRSVAQWLQIGASIDSAEQILEGNPVDRLVYTTLLTVGLIVLFSRRPLVGRLLRANHPVLLFFLYCAASLLWSDFPAVAFKRWTKAVGDFTMVLVVLSDREPTVAIKRLLARTSFLLIPLSILFIKYYPDLGRGWDRWDGTTYYVGVTLNKNVLGAICLFLGLGAMWRILDAYRGSEGTGWIRQRRLLAHSVILSMVIWMFSIANAKTSLSCFLMGSVLLVMASFRSTARRPAVIHLLVATMLVACICVLFLGFGSSVLETMGRDSTLTDRTAVWALLFSIAGNPFCGTGFESFWLGPRLQTMWNAYAWRPTQAHNGYIEIFLNLGWLGVAMLGAIIAMGYRTIITAYRRNGQTGTLRLAYFLAGVVFNFTEAALFRMMAPAWILFLLAITEFSDNQGSTGWSSANQPSLQTDKMYAATADA